jgi:hypothetical protein
MSTANPTLPYRSEHLSPFLPWQDEDRRLPSPQDQTDDALIVQLLQTPTAVVDRILDPARAQSTVLTSVGIIAGSGALAAAIMLSGWDAPHRSGALDSLMVAVGLLGALAASIVPVWGLGVLRTVRMPMGQLVGLLTTSVAASSLLLVAMSAVPAVLWRMDDEWAGPLALVGAFVVAACGCALRFRSQLRLVAARTRGEQALASPADDARIEVFARNAMLVLGFTNILAGWAWLATG